MPIYSFACPECGNKKEDTRTMKDANSACVCTCGARMNRDYSADIPHAPNAYKRPIHSDSLAIHPSQRTEHEKIFPDIKLDNQHRPIFDNFAAHEKYMEKCNIVKERQKTKPKGKRIA